ncbi:Ig-like domain-containing protein [Pseudoalteromonas spongiae]|uniref:Ig-like domain-containing protein n=1 Tax=Pseudoalteromonas spongiae TaxID=298657 RepID=UPI003735E09C
MINQSTVNLLKTQLIKQCKNSLLKYIPITGLAFTSSLAFASTLNAVFTPADVGPGSTAKLTYTITNSAGTVATNTDFTAVLPTGLLHATPANAQTNCSNGTLTAPDGGTTLTFADYDIAAASSCTVSLNVIAPNTAGTYTLPAINITSSNGSSNSAAIGLDVLTTRPGITIAASPSSINVGGVSTLTFTIDNSLNASRVGNLDTSVNLPSGLVVADVPNASTDCVSGSAPNTTITAQAGSSSITLDANGSTFSPGFEVLAAGALCTVTVDVKASGLGEQLVETNSLLADFTDSGFATTNITSTPAFALMSFAPNPAVPGGSTELNIALTNYNRSESATNIAFTDDLNAVVAGMQAAGLPLSVCGGTLTGSPLLSFAGGTIGPGETCSFKLPVTIPAATAVGNYTNTTSSFTFDLGGSPQTWNPISHNLAITQAPTVTLELLSQANLIKEPIAAGDDLVARYTITNIDTINAAGGITFYTELTNALPFPVSASLPAAGFCGAGSAIGFTYPSTDVQGVTVTGGAIPAGGSCTFDVIITVPDSQPAGIYSLKAENGSATIDGETPLISDTSDTFTVVTAPSLSIALPGTVKPGDSVDATFTLTTNANSENVSDIAFTVDLNSSLSGLVVSSFSANTCSEAPTGTSMISIAAVTLASASSCSFVATLDIPASAPAGTYAISSSTVSATVNGAVVTSPSASVDLNLQELSLTMNVADAEVVPGATTQLDFTLTNLSATSDLTSIAFTSNLSAGLSGLAATSLPVNPCGGTISGTTFLILSGASLTAGDSCSFSVEVQVPGGAADGSYDLLTSEVTSSSVDSDSARAFLVIEQDLAPSVVSITSTKSPLAGTSPIPMEIVFSEEINSTTFVNSDLLVSNGSVTNLQEVSADKYTFDIIPSADGVTITAQLPAGVVADLGGSALLNTASSVFSIDYDTSALPSAVIDVISGSKTSSETLSATVTYANATQVFLTNDKVNLLFTGSASTTNFVDNNTPNPDVTILNGASSIATIQVSNIIGDGTLTIGIDEQTARNYLGNVSAIAESTNSFSIDNTAPTVAITSSAVDPINGNFIANFDFTNPALSSAETSLTGFDVTDVILNNANISNFSGSNGSYSATITPVNDGVVTININADAAQDDHGNGNIAAPAFTINYDGTKPDVSISSISSLNNGPFEATITFTESVTGFSIGAISASNANLSNFTSVSGSVYTVDVTPIVDGTVTLDIAADSVVDAANNGNTAAAQFSVSYDTTPPSLDITGPITAQNVAFTATFTFSESVTGFGVADIVVGNGSASNLQGSGAVYTALITPATEGGVTVDVASSVATDVFGNGNTVATQFSVQYDSVQPSIVVSGPVSEQNSVFTATFTFSEDVTGFNLSDISVSNGTASNLQGSGSVYTTLISPLGDGLVSINVAQALVSDVAGNTNTASNQLNVMYDTTPPTLDITGPSAAQNTAFTTTFTFSESVTGFALSDIVVGNAIASDLQGTGTTYTATITPSNEGDVTIGVASSAAFDSAGNGNADAQEFSVNYDATAPTVVINGPANTQNDDFVISINFSENVSGLALSDFTVSNAVLSNLTGSGANYSLTVNPSADGTVSVQLAAVTVNDAAGNDNSASNQFSVDIDITNPTVTLSATASVVNAPFEIIAQFSEVITGLSSRTFAVTGATIDGFSVLSNTSFKVKVVPTTVGKITVSLPQNSVTDLAGNTNFASNQLEFEYSNEAVSVSISVPDKANASFESVIDFSAAVSGFELSDIQSTNADVSGFKTLSPSSYSVTVSGKAVGDITLRVLANAAIDKFGNGSAESQTVTVAFDNKAPNIVSRVPLNNSDNVSIYSDFAITFDESIVLNSGEIKLVNLADNSVMIASNVNVVGNSLEFAFNGDLNVNTRYQLMLDPAIVSDEFGNAVGGITDWFFTTSNTAPIAENDNALTQEDSAVVIDVAANDTDSDGQLDLGSFQLSQPSNGVVSVKGAGLVEYKPNQNFNGVDSFTYTIADNSGVRSNEATVSVEITSVNDAPNFVSKPVTSIEILTEYQYQIEVSDIDSETLTTTIISGPDWLSLNDQLLQGTVPASVNGQSFEITLEVSDGELAEQQQFTLNVVEFDESLVSIVQGVNVSPILVQEAFELSVMINNASTQSIALEQLSVALEGVEVVSAASGCTFNESSYLCQEVTNIDAEDSLELVFTLRGESAGELTSAVTLTYNQELTKQDTFVQVIAEDISDEKGNKLPLSDVNSFALADFNSDGLIDIAFAANSNSAIFINQGAGKYELGASFLANEDVKHVAVADFNNDGTFDIAFATESELGSGVLYNDGNLVFTDTQIVSSIPSQWVFTFDINADALNDIILLDDSDNGISIITQPFAAALVLDNTVRQSNAVIDSEAAFNDLATGDFDNNGLIDLVLAVDDGPVEIWYQGDNSQFDIQQTKLLSANKLKVLDLNADGILEVVAITEQGLEILDVHNQELQRVSSVSYLSFDVAYLNGNQSPEIVILSESGNISIFELKPEGYALLPVVFEAQQGQDIALTDVDLDGDLDLIISSSDGDNEVRFNQGNGMFGEQTTDLVLVSTPESNSLVEGDSFEWNLVVRNQGLANAVSPEVMITSDNVVISEVESELLTCSVSDTGVICQYDGELAVEQETNVIVSLLASNLGTASVNAYVSNITVDDNQDNNSTQLALDVSAKPPVIKPEPPKKKSSGGGSYLLVIVIFFLLRRVR